MESTKEQCEHEKISRRLRSIAKIFFPTLCIIGILYYQQYLASYEIIEAEISSKNITWVNACSESSCIEIPQFNIVTSDEYYTTTEEIYDYIQPKNTYLIEVEGWSLYKSKRKIASVF